MINLKRAMRIQYKESKYVMSSAGSDITKHCSSAIPAMY